MPRRNRPGKTAPAVDLVTDLRPAARLSGDRRVRAVTGVSCQMAHDLIAGRPLVILDTLDPVLNVALAATARDAGVPVNVPDNPALCSAYLGAIVDRSPVLVAISTAGVAPAITDLTRREAGFVTVPPGLGGAQVRSFVDDLCMGPDGERIVLLLPTGPTPAMTTVVRHLLDSGHYDAVIPAARPTPVVARDLPHGPATDTNDDTGPGPGLCMSPLRHRQGQPAGGAR